MVKTASKKELPKTGLYRMVRGDRKYGHDMTKPELFGWYNDSWKMLRALEKSPYSSDKLRVNIIVQINNLMGYFDVAFPGWRADLGVPVDHKLMF